METQFSHSISEELVAAYVDGDVTGEERRRVEAAMAISAQIAWEVNSLRQTVEIMRDLPAVALPRSFVLSEDQVGDVVRARRSRARDASAFGGGVSGSSLWQRLLDILNSGNLYMRNAAALAAVLLLFVLVVETQFQQPQPGAPQQRTSLEQSAESSQPSASTTLQKEMTASQESPIAAQEGQTGDTTSDVGVLSATDVSAADDGEIGVMSDAEVGVTSDDEVGVLSDAVDEAVAVSPAPQPLAGAVEEPAVSAAPAGVQPASEDAIPTQFTAAAALWQLVKTVLGTVALALAALWLRSLLLPRGRRA